jgi:N-sulfoglucosamine sulfohydrolase
MRVLPPNLLKIHPMKRSHLPGQHRAVRTGLIPGLLFAGFLLLIHPFAWAQASRKSTAGNPPNILVFIADDAGWRDFGCYGNQAIRTPAIDALASGGLRVERAFLTSPQCSPSRTSILTGEFAHTLGTEDLHTPLREGKPTLAAYLKEAGYYSGLIRKTHIGPHALKQFDYHHAAADESQLNEFREFLNQSKNQPFFLWYAFVDPHRTYETGALNPPHNPAQVVVPPYLADTEATRRDLAMYYDEIGRMDKNIGLAVAELKTRRMLDNTLIIFLSDNGMPFTRAKGTLYDEGIRTPLIFHWPAVIKPGRTSAEMVSVIHLAPTLLDIAGLAKPESMYGRSMKSLLRGEAFRGDSYVFSERNWHDCDEHMRSIRSDSFKLVKNAYIEWPHGTAADLAGSDSHQELLRLKKAGKLSEAQSLVFQAPRPVIELYNVVDDPYELNNLAYAAAYRPVISKLYAQLLSWMEATGDFPPEKRRRHDNTDRVTGTIYDPRLLPPLYDEP